MEYRLLGQTGVKVSRLCFGTMSFGGDADVEAATAMYARCRDAGINFFDCADVYNGGAAEKILGGLIAGHRDEVVITTKVFGATGEDVNARGLSRRHIVQGVEASLKRLGTDRIDLYFCHQFDPQTPMEQTLRAMDDLVRQGKVLYPAVSNWSAWRTAKALGVSAAGGLARFECIQPMYNLVKRQAEVELLPLAESERLGCIPYSPLGGGLLTGKYGPGRRPQQGRLVSNDMYASRYGEPSYYDVAARFTEYADAAGVHPATLAVAWVMHHPGVTAPIIGARNVEQLAMSLAAAETPMPPQRREEIAALSPTPPPATDRSEERR
jgi:aryl-alcohol dehydrogenase-like predicted oxidoreductase